MIKKIENAEKYFEGSLLNGDDLLRVVVLKLNEAIDKLNEEETKNMSYKEKLFNGID